MATTAVALTALVSEYVMVAGLMRRTSRCLLPVTGFLALLSALGCGAAGEADVSTRIMRLQAEQRERQVQLDQIEHKIQIANAQLVRMQCGAFLAQLQSEVATEMAQCLGARAKHGKCLAEASRDTTEGGFLGCLVGLGAAVATGGASLLHEPLQGDPNPTPRIEHSVRFNLRPLPARHRHLPPRHRLGGSLPRHDTGVRMGTVVAPGQLSNRQLNKVGLRPKYVAKIGSTSRASCSSMRGLSTTARSQHGPATFPVRDALLERPRPCAKPRFIRASTQRRGTRSGARTLSSSTLAKRPSSPPPLPVFRVPAP